MAHWQWSQQGILIYKLTAVEKRLLGNEFIIMLLNTSSLRSGSNGQYCVHLSEDGFNFTYIAIWPTLMKRSNDPFSVWQYWSEYGFSWSLSALNLPPSKPSWLWWPCIVRSLPYYCGASAGLILSINVLTWLWVMWGDYKVYRCL